MRYKSVHITVFIFTFLTTAFQDNGFSLSSLIFICFKPIRGVRNFCQTAKRLYGIAIPTTGKLVKNPCNIEV